MTHNTRSNPKYTKCGSYVAGTTEDGRQIIGTVWTRDGQPSRVLEILAGGKK